MKQFALLSLGVCAALSTHAQVLTKEDSLNAGLVARNTPTVVAGYGSVKYQDNTRTKQAVANLDRAVLFLGHKFNNRISFFSELEVEDAKVTGGQVGGEVALEQAFLKFQANKSIYITAGLFIPRLGIMGAAASGLMANSLLLASMYVFCQRVYPVRHELRAFAAMAALVAGYGLAFALLQGWSGPFAAKLLAKGLLIVCLPMAVYFGGVLDTGEKVHVDKLLSRVWHNREG